MRGSVVDPSGLHSGREPPVSQRLITNAIHSPSPDKGHPNLRPSRGLKEPNTNARSQTQCPKQQRENT